MCIETYSKMVKILADRQAVEWRDFDVCIAGPLDLEVRKDTGLNLSTNMTVF